MNSTRRAVGPWLGRFCAKSDAPFGGNGASGCDGLGGGSRSHIVIVFVVADVAHIQNHWNFSEVLPPMRCALGFCADFAYLVDDGRRAVAGVFDNLALLDEDERRSVIM